jgi:Bacterial Ig-like domain
MRKILTIITFVLSLMVIVNITLYNIVVLRIPDASAQTSNIANFTFTPSILTKNITNTTANVLQQFLKTQQANLTTQQVKANATAEQVKANATAFQVQALTQQLGSFQLIISSSITGIAILTIAPLLFSMYFTYRQGGRGTNIRPLVTNQLYRVLVAIGVIFTIVLILIYLNSMIWFNMSVQSPIITALLETQKNFLTIIGTAFASLVAFYFGTRGSQGSNAERTTAITKPESGQKALEVNDVNPIDESIGVEVESPVTATFSAPVRSSTINPNTFSVKDANGNLVQGKITLTDNNTTIRFNPVSPLNRNSRYTITITKGLMDISGASITADKEWHFTTVA